MRHSPFDNFLFSKCVVKPSISQYSFILPIGVVLLINTYIFFALLKVIVKAKSPDKSATANAMVSQSRIVLLRPFLTLLRILFGFKSYFPACVPTNFSFLRNN